MWLSLALVFALVVAGVAARRALLVVTVAGNSMAPTYGDGDVLLAVTGRRFAVGDVVVFRNPLDHDPKQLVKRVAAIAGDLVPDEVRSVVGEDRVPADSLVVRGDNPAGSLDSRRLGLIAVRDVRARVRLRLEKAA